MLRPFLLALSLLPWIPAFLCRVTTEGELAVMEGQSLTVPCHYDPQYAGYVKYWCRGKMREFCTSLARTDPAHPAARKVSIFDDPVQQVFTVTMGDLKETDSGWYMCGVEVGGVWTADVVAYTYIKVVHGMSVVNSRLSGEEGSSVTVECHYSERYRDSEKKWCRSGDWSSCLLTGSEGSYEDTSVALRDDRTRTFTITLKKLRMRDSGWHWCSVGAQADAACMCWSPPRPTTSRLTPSRSVALLAAPEPITEESRKQHILESLLVCASIMFLVGMAILARKLWKQHRRDPVLRQVNRIKARHNEFSGDVDDPQSTGVVFLNVDSQDVHMY
ncbi:LOW QUALITY PROTEIN: polymeric immunoglobulin receptor-like [Cyclopterus lumpus]|uniref:LOW QUALITY PROTEIN: polymeric immunoglobulin receptor-like n=1 Tax=Cyclopterus lumpus TaxID=8103 RepID=UPI0014865FBE|nr:LOW QUALITY PROTEIN: polymeric immunoglobulin receptor-like [Cyclopterus lumpus]